MRIRSVLSVLAGWSLLGTLAVGLLMILKPLEGIRTSMRKIAMGVRAIEQETLPLGSGADTLVEGLGATSDTLSGTARRLETIARDLDGVASTLRAR